MFKKSCSIYVYEKTKSEGLLPGLKALQFRINNCRPYYSIIKLNGKKFLITKVNTVFEEEQIDKSVFALKNENN